MPNETTNLKLKLYDPDTDGNELVYDFIKNTAGYSNSNFVKIDTSIGEIKTGYLPLSGGKMTGTITGSLNGNASSATKAVRDGDGNTISTTYSKIFANAGSHNSIYRGANITSKFKDGSLFANIANGTFDDLYIGDYFTGTCGDVTTSFRLAGFDIYYGRGDTRLTRHHAVVVPDDALIKANMNDTAITTGGYVGSRMYKETIPALDTKLSAMVESSHLIQYRDLLSTTVDTSVVSGGYGGFTGATSAWSWYDTKCRLMSEIEVYGTRILSSASYDIGTAYPQLPLFALNPYLCINPVRNGWWLSAVADSSGFCIAYTSGHASRYGANNAFSVRPRFLIG